MNPIEYYEKMVELSYNTADRQQPVRYTTYKNSIYNEYVNFWVRDLCMSGAYVTIVCEDCKPFQE